MNEALFDMDAGLISLVGVAMLVIVQLILGPMLFSMTRAFVNRLISEMDRTREDQDAFNTRVLAALEKLAERQARVETRLEERK